MDDLVEEKVVKKRAPRKRVARSDAEAKAVKTPRKRATTVKKTDSDTEAKPKRVVRKRVSRKKASPDVSVKALVPEEAVVNEVASRKAPTPLAAEVTATQQRKRQLYVVAVMLLLGIGASAAVGFTDAGRINVQQTIEARNERIRNNVATAQDTMIVATEVPVQDTSKAAEAQKPDGGLIGRGTGGRVPTPRTELAAAATLAIASTSDATASSTDKVSEGESVVGETGETEAARPEGAPLETATSSEATQ